MKKIVSLFCLFALLISSFALMASADPAAVPADASKWDGVVPAANKDYVFEGEGTEASPWLIKSAAELAIFAANVRLNDKDTTYSGKYFKLTVDIDMDNKEWMGIGGAKTNSDGFPTTAEDPYLFSYFAGIFDGAGHKIYNFNLATSAEVDVEIKDENGEVVSTEKQTKSIHQQGLFGWIVGATVKNIGIESGNVEFNNNNRSGLLVGATRHGFLIDNCYNKANLTVNSTVKYTMVGTLVGASFDAWRNDHNYEENSEIIYKKKLITNSYNTGDLTVTMTSTDGKNEFRIGGIIGQYVGGAPEFVNVYNMGDVTVTSNNVASTGSNFRIGGIAGAQLDSAYAEELYCAGDVTFTATVDLARNYDNIALMIGNASGNFTSEPNADGVYTLGYSGKLTVNGVEQEKAIGNKTFEWLKRVDTIVLPLAENSDFLVAITAEPEIPAVTEPTETDAPATNAPAATTAKPAETTKAPTAEVTTAPTTTEAPKSTGCGASAGIISVLLISAIASGAALTLRKKED